MNILAWLVIGVVIGWLSGVVGRGSGYGTRGDILIALFGSLCGGFLTAGLFNLPDPINRFNIITILAAFTGAGAAILTMQRLGARPRSLS